MFKFSEDLLLHDFASDGRLDSDGRIEAIDETCCTPLSAAIEAGHPDVCKILIKNCAYYKEPVLGK
jgi:hypothetical protein